MSIPLKILIDWGSGAMTIDYVAARNRIESVGVLCANVSNFLLGNGYTNYSSLVIVGHSLGKFELVILKNDLVMINYLKVDKRLVYVLNKLLEESFKISSHLTLHGLCSQWKTRLQESHRTMRKNLNQHEEEKINLIIFTVKTSRLSTLMETCSDSLNLLEPKTCIPTTDFPSNLELNMIQQPRCPT